MKGSLPDSLRQYTENISRSGLSIYGSIEVGDVDFWIPTPELEAILNLGLEGISLAGLPLRTRSKVIKEHICRALGYPVPASFPKTQPRFPGQQFDTYVQKSNNLQVWNEQLSATRRYVLIRLSANDLVTAVRVVTGEALAEIDTTGTLTQKYQARFDPGPSSTELVVGEDTDILRPFVSKAVDLTCIGNPTSAPTAGSLLGIQTVFDRLSGLVGETFADIGSDQERNRGAALHQLVCQALGYPSYQDHGQFPDVRHQLIEVKLQTSPTIDLGLVLPTSTAPLDVPNIGGIQLRHCDVRYVVFSAAISGTEIALTHLVVTTGEAFFSRFQQFGGRVLNRKLQIHLPNGFFEI